MALGCEVFWFGKNFDRIKMRVDIAFNIFDMAGGDRIELVLVRLPRERVATFRFFFSLRSL